MKKLGATLLAGWRCSVNTKCSKQRQQENIAACKFPLLRYYCHKLLCKHGVALIDRKGRKEGFPAYTSKSHSTLNFSYISP